MNNKQIIEEVKGLIDMIVIGHTYKSDLVELIQEVLAQKDKEIKMYRLLAENGESAIDTNKRLVKALEQKDKQTREVIRK